MAGRDSHWNHILVASLDYREERPCIHSRFHSVSASNNSYILLIVVEGDPILGQVRIRSLMYIFSQLTTPMLKYDPIYIYTRFILIMGDTTPI